MKVTVIPIVILALGNRHRQIGTGTVELRNKRTSGDYLNYNNIKIGQNTVKSPGDLRLAVTESGERLSANADVKSS